MGNLITISGVRGFVDDTGTAQLNLEDVARGLGIVKIDTKDGVEYIRIHKQNIKSWLVSFGLMKSEDELPEFIPENFFYRLAMKAKNETAEKFQTIVCDEILPTIRKTGTYSVAQKPSLDTDAKNKNADARLKNALTRQSEFLMKEIEKRKDILSKESIELLTICALEKVAGENLLPRPKLESKYYSATDIAKEAGVSANKIGNIANNNNLKTDEYGHIVLDKSRYSNKQVETFRYNENGRKILLELLAN